MQDTNGYIHAGITCKETQQNKKTQKENTLQRGKEMRKLCSTNYQSVKQIHIHTYIYRGVLRA